MREVVVRCSNCWHGFRSNRAADNAQKYGCPVCGKRQQEAVPSLAEVTAALDNPSVSHLEAHLARRGAKNGNAK